MILDGNNIEERMIIIHSQAGWLYLSPKCGFQARHTIYYILRMRTIKIPSNINS